LSSTNVRTSEVLETKGQIEQYELKIFGAFKMKEHRKENK